MTTKHFTIYFEGTSNSINSYQTQISLFSFLTSSYQITSLNTLKNNINTLNYFKILYSGCNITNGLLGLIFAIGLNKQCEEISSYIHYILIETNYSLTLNIIGLSRGGIACLLLIKELNKYITNKLIINILLFDPVPGNLITTSKYFDYFSFSIANQTLDISNCKYINNILALYPYIPLPDLAFHAPLFPIYPNNCNVIEDACLGCHQGALFCSQNLESKLSFLRIKEWLEANGTPLVIEGNNKLYVEILSTTIEESIDIMNQAISPDPRHLNQADVVRYGHSKNSNTYIIKHSQEPCQYLNKWHEELCQRVKPQSLPHNNNQQNYEEETLNNTLGKKKYMLEIVREK